MADKSGLPDPDDDAFWASAEAQAAEEDKRDPINPAAKGTSRRSGATRAPRPSKSMSSGSPSRVAPDSGRAHADASAADRAMARRKYDGRASASTNSAEGDRDVLWRKVRDVIKKLKRRKAWTMATQAERRSFVIDELLDDPEVSAPPYRWTRDEIRLTVAEELPDENLDASAATAVGGSGGSSVPPPAPPGSAQPDPVPGDGHGDPKVLRRKIRHIITDLDDDPKWLSSSVNARRDMVYTTLLCDPDVTAHPRPWSEDTIRDMIAREVPDNTTTVVTPVVAQPQPDHLEPLRLKVRQLREDNQRLTRSKLSAQEQREDTRELLDHDPDIQANVWTKDEIEQVLREEIPDPDDGTHDENFVHRLRRRLRRRDEETVSTDSSGEPTKRSTNPFWVLGVALCLLPIVIAVVWAIGLIVDGAFSASVLWAILITIVAIVLLVVGNTFYRSRIGKTDADAKVAVVIASALVAVAFATAAAALFLLGASAIAAKAGEGQAQANRNGGTQSNGLSIPESVAAYCSDAPISYDVFNGGRDVDPGSLDGCSARLLAEANNYSHSVNERVQFEAEAQAVKTEYCRIISAPECTAPVRTKGTDEA